MLSKDTLGLALYNAEKDFNDKTIEQLGGDLEAVRKAFWKNVADEIIKHLKSEAVLRVPGTGLTTPPGGGAVTGISITGKIE